MKNQDECSEEIVIVGVRYGKFADAVKPLYEKGNPDAAGEG